MTRISNLSTIKIGVLNSWNSYWFDKYYYSYLLLSDLKLKDYFTGIFYNLKIISDYLYIYRFIEPIILFKTTLIFLDDIKFKSISIKDIQAIDNHFRFFYYKKLWDNFLLNLKLIHLFDIKHINFKFNKKDIVFFNLESLSNRIIFYSNYLKFISLFVLYRYYDNIFYINSININIFIYNLNIKLPSLHLLYSNNESIYNYYTIKLHTNNRLNINNTNKKILSYFLYYICSSYYLINYYNIRKEKILFTNLTNLSNLLINLLINLQILLKY
jgi:hypothetical protein